MQCLQFYLLYGRGLVNKLQRKPVVFSLLVTWNILDAFYNKEVS